MDETIEWLRSRPYYAGQLVAHEIQSGRSASYATIDLDPRLDEALTSTGIDRLYQHQADAIEAIRASSNVVMASPTASGKSLG